MWSLIAKLLGGVGSIVGRSLPDRNRQNEGQSRINEAEVSGAPASRMRLWRSFLGWILGRMVIAPLFFAQWGQNLPPSALDQIMALLLGMLGLGF